MGVKLEDEQMDLSPYLAVVLGLGLIAGAALLPGPVEARKPEEPAKVIRSFDADTGVVCFIAMPGGGIDCLQIAPPNPPAPASSTLPELPASI